VIAVPRVAFIGFGSLAQTLAARLGQIGTGEVRAYARPRADAAAAEVLAQRLREAGAVGCDSIADAVRDTDVVIAAVPAGAAADVAAQAAPALARGALYVDPAPVPPADKERSAALVEAAGADYVDAAVLGTVLTEGHQVPLLVSGRGAGRFAQLGGELGLRVAVIEGPAGRATLVKLLRSVYLKGRDALVLEMLLAARAYGLDGTVVDSIAGAGEQVSFAALADRVLPSLALYAERRAQELAASADVVAKAGVDPIVTAAGAERLRRLAELDLRARLAGERPQDREVVLALLDEVGLSAPGPAPPAPAG